MKRVILDTNLWISFLISKNQSQLDKLILAGKIQLIFSPELIEEFIDVATLSKLKKVFTQAQISKVLELFDLYGKLVTVNSKIAKCRDPKDDFLLNLALESNADYLITGDTDLLVLKKIGHTDIISWNTFIAIIH